VRRRTRAVRLAAGSCLAVAALAACRTAPPAHSEPAPPASAPPPQAPAAPPPVSALPAPPATPAPAAPAESSAPSAPASDLASRPDLPAVQDTQPPAPPVQGSSAAVTPLPPCVPPAPRAHHPRRHKKKEVEQGPEPPQPTAPPKSDAVVDAQVGQVETTLMSILGKDVKSPTGEDMGRVVDVLADAGGHVRVAIIDFGGFLGVGNRRIAVDWPLLHFNPAAGDKWITLSVTRQKLQSTPEYKDPSSPRVLMPPPAPPDAANTGPARK
jgi:PRC-barrel domain